MAPSALSQVHNLFEFRDRLFQLASFRQRESQDVVRVLPIRAQLDRFPEILDRRFIFARFVAGFALTIKIAGIDDHSRARRGDQPRRSVALCELFETSRAGYGFGQRSARCWRWLRLTWRLG